MLSYSVKYLIKEYIQKTGQTQSSTLCIKKGNPNDPNNYWDTSVSDVSGTLFSTIINRPLQMRVNMNDVIGEQQAGFRKDYSTVNHIFTLLAIVQKQLSLNFWYFLLDLQYDSRSLILSDFRNLRSSFQTVRLVVTHS